MPTFLKTVESYQQGARTLPGRYYTAPEVFAAEQERIFQRNWICVGRDAALADPGDYLVVEIAGESLIVLRDQSGERRAYYNVCRHRGTRLCEAPRGRLSETIQCPYHAWTYALDGRLIGAPHMNEIEGFDKKSYPLHRVALHEWAGFLFVNLDPHAVAAEQWFAPLHGRFDRYNLRLLRTVRRIEYDVRANWKLILQNYNECLHCPTIHPELSTKLPYTSGANDLIERPFLGGHMEIKAPNENATLTARACALPLGGLDRVDRLRAFLFVLFTPWLISLHPDYPV